MTRLRGSADEGLQTERARHHTVQALGDRPEERISALARALLGAVVALPAAVVRVVVEEVLAVEQGERLPAAQLLTACAGDVEARGAVVHGEGEVEADPAERADEGGERRQVERDVVVERQMECTGEARHELVRTAGEQTPDRGCSRAALSDLRGDFGRRREGEEHCPPGTGVEAGDDDRRGAPTGGRSRRGGGRLAPDEEHVERAPGEARGEAGERRFGDLIEAPAGVADEDRAAENEADEERDGHGECRDRPPALGLADGAIAFEGDSASSEAKAARGAGHRPWTSTTHSAQGTGRGTRSPVSDHHDLFIDLRALANTRPQGWPPGVTSPDGNNVGGGRAGEIEAEMSRVIKRRVAAVAVGALAVSAVALPGAFAVARSSSLPAPTADRTPPTFLATLPVASAAAWVESAISARTAVLASLTQSVGASTTLSSVDRTALSGVLQSDINSLATLSPTVAGQTTIAMLRADAQSIVGEHVLVLVKPVVTDVITLDSQLAAARTLQKESTALSAAISAAHQAKRDIGQANSEIHALGIRLSEVNSLDSSLPPALIALTPQSWPAPQSTLSAASLAMAHASQDLSVANNDVSAIVSSLSHPAKSSARKALAALDSLLASVTRHSS